MHTAGRVLARTTATLAVAGLAVSLLAACGQRGSEENVATTAPGSPSAHPAVKAIAYNLYTHCGIDEAKIGDHFYKATPPLSDGSGNPPAGWGNPYQPGTMTLVSATEAVFTDHAGHHVLFRIRSGATTFERVCS